MRKHYSYSVYEKKGIGQDFDREKLENQVSRMFLEEQTQWIMKELPKCSVLDVGAGTGRIAIPLSKAGYKVTAVDASEEMLKQAKKKASGLKIKFKNVDAHKLPYPAKQFDSGISIRTLMHFPDWKKAISELCRVCRRDIIIDCPPVSSLAIAGPIAKRIQSAFKKDAQTYRVFRYGTVRKELEKNGFNIIRIKKQYVLPMFIHRMSSPKMSRAVENVFAKAGLTSIFGAPLSIHARRER